MFKHLRNHRNFFSDYYLGSVYGRGSGKGRKKSLADGETNRHYRRFASIYRRAEDRADTPSELRERLARPLLGDILGFHLAELGKGEADKASEPVATYPDSPSKNILALHPSADAVQAGSPPLLLLYTASWDENLDSVKGKNAAWSVLGDALAETKLPYGLMTNGKVLRLVRRPGDGPNRSFLEVDLEGLAEEESLDEDSFAAFFRLFHRAQFEKDQDGVLPLQKIEQESRSHAKQVSEDLKRAVFQAAETLTGALVAQKELGTGTLKATQEPVPNSLITARDAALLALYRLLFILYAEDRDTRLDGHLLYKDSYSIRGLLEEIQGQPDLDLWPENRSRIWLRLKALFRLYDLGLPAITPYENIPAKGGDFFSSTTPEGRLLDEVNLPDRLIARVLVDLATTPPQPGLGRERVSFRELDIESLGSVYEGLLEYEPRVAEQTMYEIRVQGKPYVLTLADIRRFADIKKLRLPVEVENSDSETEVPDDAEEEPGVSEDSEESDDEEAEADSLPKGARMRLERILNPGSFFFSPGMGRKGSGSYYTPRELVQDLVKHALGPLIEGKKAREIEALRVLDPACGSAHFLVEAMRFLGQALHRAYTEESGPKGPPEFHKTILGWDSDFFLPDREARSSEARAWCKRRIAERCLYGVDLNPTAVQLAQVSLWIESLAGDRPLSYFKHHIRCGNSLLGTWLRRVQEPATSPSKKGKKGVPSPLVGEGKGEGGLFSSIAGTERDMFGSHLVSIIRAAAQKRRLIDEGTSESLKREGVEPESVQEWAHKARLHKEADDTLAGAKILFDLRSAIPFVPDISNYWDDLAQHVDNPELLDKEVSKYPWSAAFQVALGRESFFHWELEFPEVFLGAGNQAPSPSGRGDGEGGFDAALGNPPWEKILPSKHEYYGAHDLLIRTFVGRQLDARIKILHDLDPTLKNGFDQYRDRINLIATTLKKGGDFEFHEWQVDGETSGGHQDLFKFFVERNHQLLRPGGRVGILVPSAIYNNEGCTGLRHMLLNKAQIERFYAFENRRKIFNIHASYKFVNLVFHKVIPSLAGRGEGEGGFHAAFMRHDPAELLNDKPKPWTVWIKKVDLEKLSPGTLAFLEYRSERDQEIIRKMYAGRPLLGDQGPGTWNAKFYSEFNMTNDADLWTDSKDGGYFHPRKILGKVSGTTDKLPYYEPKAMPEIRARMAENGFWPLYEGKHIEQFLVDIRPIDRWVSLELATATNGKAPDPSPKLVFRDIASNTNERTCIAAVLPVGSCFGHTLSGLQVGILPDLGATVLNSLAFDFALRFRTGGMHLSFNYMALMPVVLPAHQTPMHTLSAGPYGIDHISSLANHFDALWNVQKATAAAYALAQEDMRYILESFPVFARKRPELHALLLERLEEWQSKARPTNAPRSGSGQIHHVFEVPFYEDLAVAAGTLESGHRVGSSRTVKIHVTQPYRAGKGEFYFAARVRGASMEPSIPDGSLCLFLRRWPPGLKNGTWVLVQRSQPEDSERSGAFVVKEYRQVGSGEERQIELVSLNPKFPVIHPTEEDKILAECLEVVRLMNIPNEP